MEWRFCGYALNADRAELIGPEGPVHIERSPLNLLQFLIKNSERVVSREDLIEAVWGGRIVSDATISTTVKQARRAVGDSGAEQLVIKTIHGRGFRFVAALEPTIVAQATVPPAGIDAPERVAELSSHGAGRPSIAVMRFVQLASGSDAPHLADALPAELITGLSRMRWLHVIARGSSFQFDPRQFDPADVGARLGVRFIVTGLIEVVGDKIAISLEIQSTTTGSLIWSERFAESMADVQIMRSNIVAAVIAAIELTIPQYEAMEARKLSASQFDAWSHFHQGLSYIFKFNRSDNLAAAKHFKAALDLDPMFARAHAGLSFTHWQNGFMFFSVDRKEDQRQALAAASRALDIDPTDPFVNFNMGRAQWLEGDLAACRAWLDRAIQINPNYAQCHYNKGLVLAMDGQPDLAHSSSSTALSLSPLDPLAYAMHGTRAMSSIVQEDFASAVRFAESAMQLPGAHVYIALIAALSHEMNGSRAAAETWRDHALASRPDISIAMFFAAFPFSDQSVQRQIIRAFRRLGITD